MNERGDYYLCRIISGAHTEFTFQVSLLDASEYVSVGLEDYASPDAYGMIHRCFRHPEDSKGLGSLVLVDGAFVVTADLAHTWGAMQDLMALDTPLQDRKSTRLNSSHVAISYAVFCLKKKKMIISNMI